MTRVEQSVRPLNEKERRLLSAAVAWRKRRLDVFQRRVVLSGMALLVAFWGMIAIATAADKKGPAWYYEGLISIAIAVSISLWVYFDLKPKFLLDLQRYENALRRNQACVTRIQSNAVVEFEEQEDEGACYAFQLNEGRIVFLSGQEFYASARFPNSDFSVVEIHHSDGTLVERFIEKNGTRLKPLRMISRKSLMKIPEDFESVKVI